MKKNLILMTALFAGTVLINDGVCRSGSALAPSGNHVAENPVPEIPVDRDHVDEIFNLGIAKVFCNLIKVFAYLFIYSILVELVYQLGESISRFNSTSHY